MRMTSFSAHIDQVDVSYYKIPTDLESDGTLDWDHTNLTIVTVRAGNEQDLGYTYGGSEVAAVIHGVLADKTTCHRKACIGEYGYTPFYFREMLEDRCVDVPQADITRCGGVTALLQVSAVCVAFNYPPSGHTAPTSNWN